MEMFHDYAAERTKLERRLAEDRTGSKDEVNYARLQALEASLNLWLRRVSDAMGRALEQQFYRRYTDEVRLLANKELGQELQPGPALRDGYRPGAGRDAGPAALGQRA